MGNAEMTSARFVICVRNAECAVSLELWKVYRLLPDAAAAKHHCVRVIDESGEDYLYPEECFVKVALPPGVRRAMMRTGARTVALSGMA